MPETMTAAPRQLLERAARTLLDPQGRDLAAAVQWWTLPDWPGDWPVAVLGEGPPLLLLHGFDSSHLEYRRLAPLLARRHQLVIPDLFGFGFCPRPLAVAYTPTTVLVELARRQPQAIERLLLLAPAGLTGRPMPVPPLLDQLGARFLALPGVRRGLCRTAFADPDRDVGPAELEIASLHLRCPGWAPALAAFARSGGFAGCGEPLPGQPIQVLWGRQDRILRPPQKRAAQALLGERIRELDGCGHLPHIDQPATVADFWHG